jgi:hypothetical protein
VHFLKHNGWYKFPDPLNPGKQIDKQPANCASLLHLEFAANPGLPPKIVSDRLVTFVRPTAAIFKQQVDFVAGYADLRQDRQGEILVQMTPPLAFWSSVVYLQPGKTRYTLELLDAALRLANFAEMRIKQAMACRRPHEYSPQIQPIIPTPGHGALPSGHATEAFVVAHVLWSIFEAHGYDGAWREQLMRQAARIAINRTIAGVHFPIDSAAGQLLGLTLGEYFVARCKSGGAGSYDAWGFHGPDHAGTTDFDGTALYDWSTGTRIATTAYGNLFGAVTVKKSPILNWLWSEALAEWP